LALLMGKRIPAELCAYCKGAKKLCGAKVCPILLKFDYLKKDIKRIHSRELVTISPPDFLVGEWGYPSVNFGPLSSQYESFRSLFDILNADQFDLIDILKMRLNYLYSFRKVNVKRAYRLSRNEEVLRDLAISIKPVETEIKLKKDPSPRVFLDPDIPPVGLRAPLDKIEEVGNSYAPRKVENAVEEDEKASILLAELYEYGISNYHLIRLLSTGLLGRKHRRRIVPTRWAITATDVILGDFFLGKIKEKGKEIADASVFHHEHLGNIYYILLIPNDWWGMEMFEIWMPMSVWVRRPGKPVLIQIYELYNGKANKMDGGYYAIRFSILEWLKKNYKKALAIAVRIIKPEYFAGVGNWQIREGVRRALSKEPVFKGEFEDALRYLRRIVLKETGIDIVQKSKLLKWKKQPRLIDYFYSR